MDSMKDNDKLNTVRFTTASVGLGSPRSTYIEKSSNSSVSSVAAVSISVPSSNTFRRFDNIISAPALNVNHENNVSNKSAELSLLCVDEIRSKNIISNRSSGSNRDRPLNCDFNNTNLNKSPFNYRGEQPYIPNSFKNNKFQNSSFPSETRESETDTSVATAKTIIMKNDDGINFLHAPYNAADKNCSNSLNYDYYHNNKHYQNNNNAKNNCKPPELAAKGKFNKENKTNVITRIISSTTNNNRYRSDSNFTSTTTNDINSKNIVENNNDNLFNHLLNPIIFSTEEYQNNDTSSASYFSKNAVKQTTHDRVMNTEEDHNPNILLHRNQASTIPISASMLIEPRRPEILIGNSSPFKRSLITTETDEPSPSMSESTCTLEYEEEYDDRFDVLTKYSTQTDDTDRDDDGAMTDTSYDIMSDVTQDIRYKHKIPFRQHYPCAKSKDYTNRLIASPPVLSVGVGAHKRLRGLSSTAWKQPQQYRHEPPVKSRFYQQQQPHQQMLLSQISLMPHINEQTYGAKIMDDLLTKRNQKISFNGFPASRLTVSNVTVNKCTVEREIYNDMAETATENDIFPMRYAETKVPIYRSKDNIIGSIEDLRKYKAMKLVKHVRKSGITGGETNNSSSLTTSLIDFRTGVNCNTNSFRQRNFIQSPLIECDIIHMV